jgi:hypothetical protein
MTRILSLTTLFFFFIALPLTTLAVDVYRTGSKNHPLGGTVRPVDWHMTGDTVHAHETKGLSFNSIDPGDPGDRKKKVWSISDHDLKDHPLFKLVHNGKHDDGNGGVHPHGHASLTYRGPDIHKNALKIEIGKLWHLDPVPVAPPVARSFIEDEVRMYRRSMRAERVYRRAALEDAYRRALEALEEMD